MEPKRTLRYFYLRFLRLRGNPNALALGVAIGIFVGVTPTIPLHTIMIILLAVLLRASKVAALLASLVVSNPFTFGPQYYLAWLIGNSLLQTGLSRGTLAEVMGILCSEAGFLERLVALSHVGKNTLAVLLTGGVVLALPLAVLGYFISLRFFWAIHLRRMRREAQR